MTFSRIQTLFTVVFSAMMLSALSLWLLYDPVDHLTEFHPGLDGRPAGAGGRSANVEIGSFFLAFSGVPSSVTASWPRFRGSGLDNISVETVRLARDWGGGGPNRLWSIELGEGHAGPVVAGGRVYVMDYDEQNRRDLLRCFSLDDGAEIWRRGYDIHIKRNHGMSRTVPAVKGNTVVTIGPKCQAMCATADSGAFLWGIDIEKEFSSEVPLWYTGQCPLIDDTLAVIATGGDALLIGVDLQSGEIVWRAPNPDGWKMSHSSVVPMTLHGCRTYVYAAIGGMVGVSAEAGDAGRILFKNSEWSPAVIAPSPVHIGGDRIFQTAGYGAGSALYQVNRTETGFELELLMQFKPEAGLCSEQQTPLLYDGHLFSVLPKDAGPGRNQFVCAPADDPRSIVWASARDARFGLGPYVIADGKFYILSDDGVLTLAQASTREYVQLSQVKVLDGQDAWGPMAIVDGRLLCRDSRTLVCLDLRASS